MHVFSVASSIWPLKTVLLLVEVALLRKQIFFFITFIKILASDLKQTHLSFEEMCCLSPV